MQLRRVRGQERPPRPARGRRRGRSHDAAQGPRRAPAAPRGHSHRRDEIPRPPRPSRGLVRRDAATAPRDQNVRRGEHAGRVPVGVPRAPGPRRGRHGGVDMRREHDRRDPPIRRHHEVLPRPRRRPIRRASGAGRPRVGRRQRVLDRRG